jgi:hypothetical protein
MLVARAQSEHKDAVKAEVEQALGALAPELLELPPNERGIPVDAPSEGAPRGTPRALDVPARRFQSSRRRSSRAASSRKSSRCGAVGGSSSPRSPSRGRRAPRRSRRSASRGAIAELLQRGLSTANLRRRVRALLHRFLRALRGLLDLPTSVPSRARARRRLAG